MAELTFPIEVEPLFFTDQPDEKSDVEQWLELVGANYEVLPDRQISINSLPDGWGVVPDEEHDGVYLLVDAKGYLRAEYYDEETGGWLDILDGV